MPKFKVGDYVSIKKQYWNAGFEMCVRRIENIKNNRYSYSLTTNRTDPFTTEQSYEILDMLMELDVNHMASLEVNEWLK